MSLIRIFGWNGVPVGEVTAICNRGWAVNSGGTSSIKLKDARAIQPWLNFGCIALIEHESLPVWAGMIDPDWKATSPVQLTIYDIPYALKQRTPDYPIKLTGSTGDILFQLVSEANKPGDTLVRCGQTGTMDASITQTIEQRPVWDQMVEVANKAGVEMVFTPTVDVRNQLVITMDALIPSLGEIIWALKDGKNGNMDINDVSVTGAIYNRVLGTSDESTVTSRKRCLLENPVSIAKYGLRCTVVVFPGIKSQSDLDKLTAAYLAKNAFPRIKLTASVLDKEGTFNYLRIGNVLQVHASKAKLPGGDQGWMGAARIAAMSYDESKNTVNLTIEGTL